MAVYSDTDMFADVITDSYQRREYGHCAGYPEGLRKPLHALLDRVVEELEH